MTIALGSIAGWFAIGVAIGWLQLDPTATRRRRWYVITAASVAACLGGAIIPIIGVTTSSPLWTLSLITAMTGGLAATIGTSTPPETLNEPTRPLSRKK